jgi:hypothetical protein
MIAGVALPAARELIEEHGRKVTAEKLPEAAPRLVVTPVATWGPPPSERVVPSSQA